LRALVGEATPLIPLCAVSRGGQSPTRNIEKIGSGGYSTEMGLLTVKRWALAQAPLPVLIVTPE
jgi:hypothetical protein